MIRVQNSESDITAEYSVTVSEKEEEDGPEDPGIQENPGKQEDPGKQDGPGKQTTPAGPTPKGQKTQQQTTDQKAAGQETTDRKAAGQQTTVSRRDDTGGGRKSGAVNTGDNSEPFVWLLLIVCSAVIMRSVFRGSFVRNRNKQ